MTVKAVHIKRATTKKKKVCGDRNVIHRQRDTQIHSEKWVTLKNTSLEKNSARREPARHRWPSLAAAAQQESIVSAPDADLDAHFIAGTFLAFFFSGPTTRMEAILARPLWHKRPVHYSGRGGVEKNNLSAGASPSA